MNVDEAIAVLEQAAKTPRARAALATLQSELGDRASGSKTSTGKPRFPDANSVAEHFGGSTSARGGNSAMSARGPATARKGS